MSCDDLNVLRLILLIFPVPVIEEADNPALIRPGDRPKQIFDIFQRRTAEFPTAVLLQVDLQHGKRCVRVLLHSLRKLRRIIDRLLLDPEAVDGIKASVRIPQLICGFCEAHRLRLYAPLKVLHELSAEKSERAECRQKHDHR